MAENNETKTTLPKQSGSEIGKSGTLIFNGIISAEEYNANLTGIRAYQKYEIMRRSDSTVRSALQIVKLPILSAKWDIEPAKDDEGKSTPEDEERARYIKRELFERKINFDDTLKQALTQFDFGFSVFEKVYELTEFEGKPRIGLKKLASRKQSTIHSWETQDKKPGVTQQVADGSFASIPREKLMVFTHDKEGDNYVGISLLRYVYKEWDIKDKLIIINAIALEKLGVGVPVVQAKEGQTPTTSDEADAIATLKEMRANQSAYLKVPNTMTVEMLDMKASSTKEIEPFLNYLDGRIMTAILARFMELGGASGTGAQSLSKDLSSIFMKAEEAVAKSVVATFTEDLIKQLCDFNFTDMGNGYPKLTFGTIADDDTVELATNISSLVTAGAITPDPQLENNLRERMRLPEISEDDIEKYRKNQMSPIDLGPIEDDDGSGGGTGKTAVSDKDKKELEKDKDVQASLERARRERANLQGFLGASAGA